MGADVLGRVTISTASLGVLRSQPGASIKLGKVKRTSVGDDQGIAGRSQETVAPSIQATFTKKSGVSAKAIGDLDHVDISFEGDDGSHYILRDASCIDQVEVGKDGIMATFEGVDTDEVSA